MDSWEEKTDSEQRHNYMVTWTSWTWGCLAFNRKRNSRRAAKMRWEKKRSHGCSGKAQWRLSPLGSLASSKRIESRPFLLTSSCEKYPRKPSVICEWYVKIASMPNFGVPASSGQKLTCNKSWQCNDQNVTINHQQFRPQNYQHLVPKMQATLSSSFPLLQFSPLQEARGIIIIVTMRWA